MCVDTNCLEKQPWAIESLVVAMHAAKLLSGEEPNTLEDIVGDFVAEKLAVGVFSLEMVGCNAVAARLQ